MGEQESKIILDLKNMQLPQAVDLCNMVKDRVYAVKIHDLYDKYSRRASSELHKTGVPRVWIDYKLHDMPNTVASRTKALVGGGASIVTVHAAGGADMMRAAVEANMALQVYAVTELTSRTDEDTRAEYGMSRNDLVLQRARTARQADVAGVVCSAREVRMLRDDAETAGLKLVVPGTRSPGAEQHDQKMVETPAEAVRNGADLLVIGRQVTTAADPVAALE